MHFNDKYFNKQHKNGNNISTAKKQYVTVTGNISDTIQNKEVYTNFTDDE